MIVYKFGGSILKDKKRVMKQISMGVKKYQKVVVIVSAVGRNGDPYATDTLLGLSRYVTKKEQDRLVSCGEIISSVILSNELQKNGLKAVSVSPSEISLSFDKKFSVSSVVWDYFSCYDVLVIPGFIGVKNFELVTLERGGSNTTAAFFAYYFHCNLVIFTDVDGLYDVDPKIDHNARRLWLINPDELLNLVELKPTLFPKLAIEYIKKGNFFVLFTNLDYQNGTIIGNFFE